MTTTTIDLEELFASKKFRMAAGATWLVLFLIGVGFLVAAKLPGKPVVQASVPSAPLNVPLMRTLPQPEPMKSFKLPANTIARRR
jgi:hypothetical protein